MHSYSALFLNNCTTTVQLYFLAALPPLLINGLHTRCAMCKPCMQLYIKLQLHDDITSRAALFYRMSKNGQRSWRNSKFKFKIQIQFNQLIWILNLNLNP